MGETSEKILGSWMNERKNRNPIVIATKVGSQNQNHPVDSSRKHIMKSVDESLLRLQTDYIDIYYTHFDDEKTPVEETLSAYGEIIRAGKVRYIGLQPDSPAFERVSGCPPKRESSIL